MEIPKVREKSLISRRNFCASAAGVVLGALAKPEFLSAGDAKKQAPAVDVATIDRGRVLSAAQRYLLELPVTITSFTSPRDDEEKHYYFSEADYWRPDPKDPAGPYTHRYGVNNP